MNIRFAGSLLVALFTSALVSPTLTRGQETLQHSIAAPAVGAQNGAALGLSSAMDGPYTVVGAPFDDLLGGDSGVVKVFDSNTGALLHLLANPSPLMNDNFGYAVAISGTRVVVGAYGDNTGANDAGSAYVYDLSGPTPTVPVLELNNPDPGAADSFGYAVAISGTRVVVGAYRDDTGAVDAGSAYVYNVTGPNPAVPIATLNDPSPEIGDRFGYAVAISGPLAVVGAYADDTGGIDSGTAYVYDLDGLTPEVPAFTLNNPAPGESDLFATAVAISGTRIAVGAHGDDTAEVDSGSVYVFDVNVSSTVPVATLNDPGISPLTGDRFGTVVGISGSRVVVGAYGDDTGALDAGTAYVYDIDGGTPTVPVETLRNPTPGAEDLFAYSVAISGSRVAVGAMWDDTGATDAGSAYLYDLIGGPRNESSQLLPSATLNNPGPAAMDMFGSAVAISGSLVVVGAYGDDTGTLDAGSAYVFDLGSPTPLVAVATLHNPSPAPNDQFGFAVGISGTRVVVGAYLDDSGASNAGCAHVFDLAIPTSDKLVVTLNNPSPAANDRFGYSVGISGSRVVVGAYQDDTSATDAGAVYVYDIDSGTPSAATLIKNPSAATTDQFGFAVAISGARVVAGTPGDDTGATDAGRAYLYDLINGPIDENGPQPTATLDNPGPATSDRFGAAVAISGTRAVVGAFGDDTGATDAGSAYVYDVNGGALVATLTNPAASGNDQFGFAVAISGTRVVVGAQRDDAGATDSGSAYVYELTAPTPEQPLVTLANPTAAVNDQFGFSVAIDGTTAAISAPRDDSPQDDKGSAHIFHSVAGSPEIAVEQAATDIVSGGTHGFGSASVGTTINRVFTVKNLGTSDLILSSTPKVVVSGAHQSLFTVTVQPGSPVAANDETTFTVQFAPTSPGPKTAALEIANNDGSEGLFVVNLSGTGVNDVPLVEIIAPNSANEDVSLNIGFTATDDTLDQAAGFAWSIDYGDGSALDTLPAGTASPLVRSHTFTQPGNFVITATATDQHGGISAQATHSITILDVTPPVITSTSPNLTVPATSPAGAIVTYNAATATDAGSTPSITYSQNSGTTFPIGTTTVTVTATDAATNSSTASFTVTVNPLTPVQDWRFAKFGTTANSGNAADGADPDGDGLINAIEFGFDTNPTSASSGRPTLIYTGTFAGGGTVTATGQPRRVAEGADVRALFIRRSDHATAGLTYVVEFTANLSAWETSAVVPTVLANDGTAQVVSVPYPALVGGQPPKFFRVRVSLAP